MGLWKLWVKRTHSTELTINPYPYRLCALVLGHLDIRNIRAKGKEVTIGQQKKYVYASHMLGVFCYI